MIIMRKLPEGRTFDQVKNHYEVEKSLASKLKNSTREQRKTLYPFLYKELFQRVPDHPRLVTRKNAENQYLLNRRKFELVRKFIKDSTVFAEFAPGDCLFASFLAQHVRNVYAVDISDQRSPSFHAPHNFKFVLYDGFNLDLKENSADLVFSDQLVEHLHPEDVECHFALVKRILRNRGMYIFRTPHAFFGPHDISRYFSDEPEGFHLKEWTFSEISQVLKKLNYHSCSGYWMILKGINKKYLRTPTLYFNTIEKFLKNRPKKIQRLHSKLFLPRQLVIMAIK